MSSSFLSSRSKLLDGSLCTCRLDFLCFRGGCQTFGFGSGTSGHSARKFFDGRFGNSGLSLGSYSLWHGLLGRGARVLKSEVKLMVDRSDEEVAYFFESIRARLGGEFDFA